MAVLKMKNGDNWDYVFCSQLKSNVPEFTAEDNGKVLTIVDGVIKWAEVTGGGAVEELPSAMEVSF